MRYHKPLHGIKAPIVNEVCQVCQEDGEIAVQGVVQVHLRRRRDQAQARPNNNTKLTQPGAHGGKEPWPLRWRAGHQLASASDHV